MEEALKKIINSVSNAFGEAFFDKLIITLSEVVAADYAYIALVDGKKLNAKSLVFTAYGKLAENFEYSLLNTPCENVVQDGICAFRQSVTKLFPMDELLKEMNLEAYIGVPLHSASGQVIGIFATLFKTPVDLEQEKLVTTLLQLFSGRISGEITRIQHEKEIAVINQNLERLIDERSRELEQSMRVIDLAQDKLVESEKMAGLLDLVSGIAHDVNTPLGVAITAETHLQESLKSFSKKFEQNLLKRSDIVSFLQQNDEAVSIIHRNLVRAKDLLANFKKSAADQHSLDRELININDYYHQVADMLSPLLKSRQAKLKINCSAELIALTYPGAHAQVLTNLVNNSLMHGFVKDETHQIEVNISRKTKSIIEVDYRDNGVGILPEIAKKIYEPFYTTAKGNGGTGLGMAIIFNIMAKKLCGEIRCVSELSGAHFIYTFKDLN